VLKQKIFLTTESSGDFKYIKDASENSGPNLFEFVFQYEVLKTIWPPLFVPISNLVDSVECTVATFYFW
jgi:hypothetical protein